MHACKSTIIGILLLLLLSAPRAQSIAQSQSDLLLYIQSLLDQLIALQEALQKRESASVVQGALHHVSLSPSRFYNGPYVAMYTVTNTALTPYPPTTPTAHDQALFDLWHAVIGSSAVRDYIAEFRVYHDPDAEYDAFVEQFDEQYWVFGVNDANVHVNTISEKNIATELFVHEYAHILIQYEFEIGEIFRKRFWEQENTKKRTHFVSEYAMIDYEEDFAESFAYYVLDIPPSGGRVAEAKIDFFDSYRVFRNIKKDINDRI